MEKNSENGHAGQGPASPQLMTFTAAQAEEFLERDLTTVSALVSAILGDKALLQVIAAHLAGVHNNRVEARLRQSQPVN